MLRKSVPSAFILHAFSISSFRIRRLVEPRLLRFPSSRSPPCPARGGSCTPMNCRFSSTSIACATAPRVDLVDLVPLRFKLLDDLFRHLFLDGQHVGHPLLMDPRRADRVG